MPAVIAYNSDPAVREIAEDGSLAASVPSFVDFYSAFGVDVLDGNIVVLAYDNTTNGLTFYTLDPTDLSIVSSVAMDPAWGSQASGVLWGSSYLPIAIDPAHNLITVVYEGGFNLVQFNATTGLHVDDLAITMVANAEPNLPLIAPNRVGDGYWVNRRDPSARHEVVYLVPVDGSGHVTSAGMTEPTWSTHDLDIVIHDTLDPVDQNEILTIQGLRELPNGHLLITGENGSAVEVDVSSGTIVNFIKPAHFIGHESIGLGLDADGLSYWTTFNGTPTSTGLPPPSGGASGDFDAWVAKIAMADGSVGVYYVAHPSASPMAAWAGTLISSPIVRDATDDAPAVDSAHRIIWRPTGELISNPLLLHVVRKPVPTPPLPPPPEPIPPPPPPVFNPVTLRRQRRETTIRPPGRRVRENTWASDVPVSRPVPPERAVLKDMGGFGFTSGGLAHNINDEQVDEIFTPTFSPPPTRGRD